MTTDFPRDSASGEPTPNVENEVPYSPGKGDDSHEERHRTYFGTGCRCGERHRRRRAKPGPAWAEKCTLACQRHDVRRVGPRGVFANAAQVQASSIGDTLQDVIEERPLSTVALALGLGFLIGVTWRR